MPKILIELFKQRDSSTGNRASNEVTFDIETCLERVTYWTVFSFQRIMRRK